MIILSFSSLVLVFPLSNTVVRGSPEIQGVENTESYQNWVDTSYKYRKNITINANLVYGNLTDFPVLIHLHDRDLKNLDPDKEINLLFTNENGSQLAHEIYDELRNEGIEVLFDDRAERAGVKFKDADLIGIPYRVIVGKDSAEGKVEFVNRYLDKKELVNKAEILDYI